MRDLTTGAAIGGSAQSGVGVRVVRRTPTRAVWIERRRGGSVVVKAWARRGWLGSVRARQHARHETEICAELRRRGAPVPEVVGVETVDASFALGSGATDAWAAVTRRVRAARSLERWLDLDRGPSTRRRERIWPKRPARLARDAGRMLGALHRAGLTQTDWHPGNLLLDRRGQWHAIDFQAAKLGDFDPNRARHELARLHGALEPVVDSRLLELAHRSWLRATHDSTPYRAACSELSTASRAIRLEIVEDNLDRWTRPSGRLLQRGGCLVASPARGLDSRLLADLETRAARLGTGRLERIALPDRTFIVVRDTPRRVRAIWLGAARLYEHHLPGLRPVARPHRRPHWAAFELQDAEDSGALGVVRAALERRGLAWRDDEPEQPAWWPLELSNDHSDAGSSSSFRFARM
ncbi:MAG: lipopolysaccharide kinase InaA family protein [Planctomycetota bacterium]